MSGLFGLVNKDDTPVDLSLLETMGAAMSRWGPDGHDYWCEGGCGLGQLLLYNTPEAVYERMPKVVNGKPFVITAAARVDNRAELCDRFNLSPAERAVTPDGDLILQAYQHWGEDCPRYIFGDWSFAVWCPSERRLFLARDHHGTQGLCYVDTPQFFAFASSQKALLALPQIQPRLNELKLALSLAWWVGDPAQTLYEGIRQLLPAHQLTVTPQQFQLSRYWYLEHVPEVRLPTAAAYVEGLQEVLERTVRSQLRSYRPVGLELSSGLDSGGLAAIAAPILGEQGKQLLSYTAVPVPGKIVPTGNRVADESPWVQAIVQHVGNIRDHYHDFAQTSPIAAIQQIIEILDIPPIACGNIFWSLGFRNLAASQGVGVLMNGYLGNATASWAGLLRSQAWLTLWRHGHWQAGLRDQLFSLFPYGVLRQIKRWHMGDRLLNRFAIRPEFAHRIQLQAHLTQSDYDLRLYNAFFCSRLSQNRLLSARQQRLRIIMPGCSLEGTVFGMLSAWYGLEARIPLMDTRLMSYCLGIPDRYFYNGKSRGLYRCAMAGRLPREVLWHHCRGLQGTDLLARLHLHQTEVESVLASLQHDPMVLAYIDLSRLQQAWAKLKGAKRIDQALWMAARVFTTGLACSLFLCRLGAR